MTEAKIRHLEMIQGAMNRASDNSLRVKGFAMLLLAGTMALALREGASGSVIPSPIAIVLLVIVVFLWLLDFYFIRQADLYRILYNEVRRLADDEIDFSMESGQYSEYLNSQYRERLPFLVTASSALHLGIAIIIVSSALDFT